MELENKLLAQISLRSMSVAFLLTIATNVSAAPGTISDVPLYTQGSAEPNIMFVLDSSGSMNEMVYPPSEYDSDSFSVTCSNPISNTYTSSSGRGRNKTESVEVQFRVSTADGSVQFRISDSDSWRTWDSTSNCFDDDLYYGAWLYAGSNSGSSYYQTGSYSGYYYNSSVSGKFLNWYFSEESSSGVYVAAQFVDDEGNAKRSKVDIRRTDVMKTAASDLISELEDVRIGLMEFNGSDGAHALLGLTSITDDNRDSILDIVSNISASGNTPLAETFEDVGRYFISGYESQFLSYVDSSGKTVQATGDTIFNSQPHWDGVSIPDTTVENSAIQYYCQKSFMVALTDGEPTSDTNVSSILKNYDYACEGPEGCTSEYMDDVIKALYDIDLRPDLTEPDGTTVVNNITSYLIGFANQGLSDTDVMVNAGDFGGGGVYSADDAAELKTTFNQIINKVQSVVGSSSSVSFNTTSLESDTALYAAQFDSGEWSGDLAAYSIDSDGSISSTPIWEAGTLLDAISDTDQRFMLTYRADLDKDNDGIADGGGVLFTAGTSGLDVANSDSENEQDLNINTSSGSAQVDNRAEDRIAYLRGDQSNEGSDEDQFRQRGSRLGDIINSTPVYVGEPDSGWSEADFPEASSYSAFKQAKSSRTPVVYVGANDGFLHGFNASTSDSNGGEEVIAYSPAALISTEDEKGLHALTSQIYQHKYYVDGTPTVVDAYVDNSWRTILVGGLRAGGKGYYALDVTDPDNFTAANASSIVMWEFTDADDSNLGYTFSRPQIGRLSNGEWVAIFGNGYNSDTGDAGLFIVYLDGDDGFGNNYLYISTETASTTDKNGMSTPAIVDSDLDGIVDRVYAGDLQGNMWVFDLSATNSSDWDVIRDGGSNPKPLFSTYGEPITAAPLVARNTSNISGDDPNLMIAFGTGQYLTDEDTADTSAGGFYLVSDNGTYGLTKSDLEARTIGTTEVEQADGSSKTFRTLTGNDLDWTSKYGWYIQLATGVYPDGGERVITRAELLRNILFFNTTIPTGQVCSAGGYGWLMSVDITTGLAPTEFAVFDANGDGEIDSSDQGLVAEMMTGGMPNESGFLIGESSTQITSNSSGDTIGREIYTGSGSREGRLTWEEMTPN